MKPGSTMWPRIDRLRTRARPSRPGAPDRTEDVDNSIAVDDQRARRVNAVRQNEVGPRQDDHARNISVMPVLGIDVGGTKTVCLLADEDERVLAEGREEGANLQGAGELALEKVLHSVMEKTLEGTGVMPSAICLGIAGVDRASDEAVVRSIMSRIGYKARILIVNDALIALQAGVGDAPGSSSCREPDRLRTAATIRARRRGPAAGATCSATKAAAIGSAGSRCARSCDMPTGADAPRA